MSVGCEATPSSASSGQISPTHDSASPWVLKLDGRHVRRQAVKLGLRSSGLAEVLEGLRAGDQVTPAAGPDVVMLQDGTRIRPMAKPATR